MSTFVANALFQQVTNPTTAVSDAIPEGGIGTDLLPSGDMQEVTNQGNKTTDWIETGGIAMDSSPAPTLPTGVAVVSPTTVPYYNQGDVVKQLLGTLTWAEIAVLLKPYLNSTTPGTGPTVLNSIPDQTVTLAGDSAFAFAANTFSGTDNTYSATKSDGSTLPFSFNGPARAFVWGGTAPNGSTTILVTATNSAGQSISTTFTVTIARTQTEAPYIISILRKFDPNIQTLYYLVEHSFSGNDTSKSPADRAKRAEETNWRNPGNVFLPSLPTFGFTNEVIAKYPYFWYGNMTDDTKPVTNTVVQFKPYVGAPDSAIITLNFTHTNVQDYGTEVYRYSPGTKITEAYTGRIAGPEKYLSCYAAGSGTIKTNLIATGSTPAYANGLKVMTTADGPYANADLFTGTKPYGSLYRDVVNGAYSLNFIDEAGNTLTFPIVVTDSGPIAVLKSGSGSVDPDPGTGGDTPSLTAVETANRDLFIPAIQWSGGKARVVHTNKPSGNGIYLISGQNEVANLPTTYDFEPGDELEITFVQGVTSSSDFASWPMTKAQVIIRFGQAPA